MVAALPTPISMPIPSTVSPFTDPIIIATIAISGVLLLLLGAFLVYKKVQLKKERAGDPGTKTGSQSGEKKHELDLSSQLALLKQLEIFGGNRGDTKRVLDAFRTRIAQLNEDPTNAQKRANEIQAQMDASLIVLKKEFTDRVEKYREYLNGCVEQGYSDDLLCRVQQLMNDIDTVQTDDGIQHFENRFNSLKGQIEKEVSSSKRIDIRAQQDDEFNKSLQVDRAKATLQKALDGALNGVDRTNAPEVEMQWGVLDAMLTKSAMQIAEASNLDEKKGEYGEEWSSQLNQLKQLVARRVQVNQCLEAYQKEFDRDGDYNFLKEKSAVALKRDESAKWFEHFKAIIAYKRLLKNNSVVLKESNGYVRDQVWLKEVLGYLLDNDELSSHPGVLSALKQKDDEGRGGQKEKEDLCQVLLRHVFSADITHASKDHIQRQLAYLEAHQSKLIATALAKRAQLKPLGKKGMTQQSAKTVTTHANSTQDSNLDGPADFAQLVKVVISLDVRELQTLHNLFLGSPKRSQLLSKGHLEDFRLQLNTWRENRAKMKKDDGSPPRTVQSRVGGLTASSLRGYVRKCMKNKAKKNEITEPTKTGGGFASGSNASGGSAERRKMEQERQQRLAEKKRLKAEAEKAKQLEQLQKLAAEQKQKELEEAKQGDGREEERDDLSLALAMSRGGPDTTPEQTLRAGITSEQTACTKLYHTFKAEDGFRKNIKLFNDARCILQEVGQTLQQDPKASSTEKFRETLSKLVSLKERLTTAVGSIEQEQGSKPTASMSL